VRKQDHFLYFSEESFPFTMSLSELRPYQAADYLENELYTYKNFDDKTYLLTNTGKIAVTPDDVILLQDNDIALVESIKKDKLFIVDKQGNRIDFVSKQLLKQIYSKTRRIVVEDTLTGTLGVVDFDGRTILPCESFGIIVQDDSIIWSKKQIPLIVSKEVAVYGNELGALDRNWIMYDLQGKRIASELFDYAFKWSGVLGIGQINGRQGLWNRQGKNILPPQYDKIWHDSIQNIFYLFKTHNGSLTKVGFANAKGEIATDAILKNMSLFNGQYAFVETENGYGILQQNGTYFMQPNPNSFQETSIDIQLVMSHFRDSFRNTERTLHGEDWFKNPFDQLQQPLIKGLEENQLTKSQSLIMRNLIMEQLLSRYFLRDNIVYERDFNWIWSSKLIFDSDESYQKVRSDLCSNYPTLISMAWTGKGIHFELHEDKNYHCYNFVFKNNIWQNLPIESILIWNEPNIAALNQLLLAQLSLVQHENLNCGQPDKYIEKVRKRFFITDKGLQFFLPRYDNDNGSNSIPLLLNWEALKPYLLN
jgi:hypothetical protein